MSNYLKANYISNARNSLGALIIVKSKYLFKKVKEKEKERRDTKQINILIISPRILLR